MNTQAPSPPSGGGPGGTPAGSDGVPGTGNDPAPGDGFFDRIRALGVVRPDEGRWIAGVCAGLARRWGVDPLLVRGLFVVVGIVSGIGLGLYGLLWLFLPHPDGRIHAQQALRGVVTAGLVGSVIFILTDLPLSTAWGWDRPGPPFSGLLLLALVGLGIWWLVRRDAGGPGSSATTSGPTDVPAYGTPGPPNPSPGGPEPETSAYAPDPTYPAAEAVPYAPPTATVVVPRPVDVTKPLRALTLTTLGAALVAAGGVVGYDQYVADIRNEGIVATAVALGVIAVGVILAGLVGRRSGGLAPIAVVLAIVAANGAAWQGTTAGFENTAVWAPTSVSAATTGYERGGGRVIVDLTQPGVVAGATGASPVTVAASLGAGELVVIVPTGVSCRVQASAGLGAITNRLDGGTEPRGGPGVQQTITTGSDPVLIVDAKVGLGHIEVVEQGTEVAR